MARKIRFVGKSPGKRDNVCGTSLFWPYPGAVNEVEDSVAMRLIRYPDAFVEVGADGDPGDNHAYPIIYAPGDTGYVKNGKKVDGPGSKETPSTPTSVENDDTVPPPPAATTTSLPDNREEALNTAIEMLVEEADESKFTGAGYPRVEAISEILGYEVNAEERTAAWDAYMADQPATAQQQAAADA